MDKKGNNKDDGETEIYMVPEGEEDVELTAPPEVDAFPVPVGIGESTVWLNADGSVSGEVDEFLKCLNNMKTFVQGDHCVIAWLIGNALRNNK